QPQVGVAALPVGRGRWFPSRAVAQAVGVHDGQAKPVSERERERRPTGPAGTNDRDPLHLLLHPTSRIGATLGPHPVTCRALSQLCRRQYFQAPTVSSAWSPRHSWPWRSAERLEQQEPSERDAIGPKDQAPGVRVQRIPLPPQNDGASRHEEGEYTTAGLRANRRLRAGTGAILGRPPVVVPLGLGFEPLSVRHGTGHPVSTWISTPFAVAWLRSSRPLSPAIWAQRLACFHGRSWGLPTTTPPLGRLSRTT